MMKKKKEPLEILKKPVFLHDKVVHGFGRGRTMLNCPTANLDVHNKEYEVLRQFDNGVYMGFATVNGNKEVFKTVVSIGTNPHFGDLEHKTVEAHLIDYDGEDFYNDYVRLIIVSHLRNMKKYNSIEELKEDIHDDIKFGREYLKRMMDQYCNHKFFKNGNIPNRNFGEGEDKS